jgi:NADH-quinone oxidoreductase subunit L
VYAQVIVAHVVAWIDRVFIDGTVNGTARLAGFGGKVTRSFQGGNIQLYIFWAVLTIIIFIIWALK